jgi:NAD(P)-dependent dehydrogenase (short-subunit alcohol dehydrogenase family)
LLPTPDWMELHLPELPVCVLTHDGSEMTAALAKKLLAEGWQVVILIFPAFIATTSAALPPTTYQFVLDNLEEEHLAQRLAEIRQKVGPVSLFIHLDGKKTSGEGDHLVFLPADRTLLKHTFLTAKHLKEDLERSAGMGFAAFMVVTHLDGELATAQQGNIAPVSAGLYGLVKTLSQEWENVFCRAVDLDPALDAERAASLVFTELHDPNRFILEVGYNAAGRLTLSVEEKQKERP